VRVLLPDTGNWIPRSELVTAYWELNWKLETGYWELNWKLETDIGVSIA
jgi:hypothetical protein